MKPLLTLHNISFAYPGHHPVLRDINLTVYEGEYLVVLGPNGSAKTTLLKLMLGLLKPFQGSVTIEQSAKAAISYLPQKSPSLNPGFPATVEEVILMQVFSQKKTGPPTGAPMGEAKVEEILDKVALSPKKKSLLATLSGGQFQRVLIARALVNNPRLLILDEPTVGLDSESLEDFLQLLAALKEEGLTIVMVTHDPAAVLEHASRFFHISRGQGKILTKDDMKVVS